MPFDSYQREVLEHKAGFAGAAVTRYQYRQPLCLFLISALLKNYSPKAKEYLVNILFLAYAYSKLGKPEGQGRRLTETLSGRSGVLERRVTRSKTAPCISRSIRATITGVCPVNAAMDPRKSSDGILPPLVRHLFYPLHERLLRRSTFAYLRQLEESQWTSRAMLEALQYLKLKELLQGARAGSAWYRERIEAAGIDLNGEAPLTLADLRRLPLLDKPQMQCHGEAMICRGVPGGTFAYNTGGSSGTPLIFHFSRLRQASDAAGRMRARRWWGVDVGDREVYLWGAPVELSRTDLTKSVRDRLFNQLVLNAFDMKPARMDDYVDTLNRFNPKCLYGYASSIALLAAHAHARGLRCRMPALRVVCTTGEPVYPHQRELIESVFGAPVANEFGSRDIGFTAHETPAGQMLLMSESHILEVLDPKGNPVAPGEAGEAVITGLCSDAQPFIRYQTGDVVRLSSQPCRQGRGLHVIDQVLGRTTDFIVRGDGAILHALAVIYVVRATPGVGEFKFIQHRVDRVEVQLVPNTRWSATSAETLKSGLRQRLGDRVQVALTLLEAIPPEASGKHRYVVSYVPLPLSLSVASGWEAP